jgi:hypothetical protein
MTTGQANMRQETIELLDALARTGLLLKQDTKAFNVVALLTGETPRSSWWSHPRGRLIFAVLSELEDHPDVLFTKLLHGKVTLIHRTLWPAFLAVAMEGAEWQLEGLSASARDFLTSVNESKTPIRASGAAVKELETRLLVHSQEVHTDSGRHAIELTTWTTWAESNGTKLLRSITAAREQFDAAATAIGAGPTALPWRRKR